MKLTAKKICIASSFLTLLLLVACNTASEKNEQKEVVFIENEDGNLEKQEVTFSENDTVQIQDPKTGEWVKMTKKEAEALGNNEN